MPKHVLWSVIRRRLEWFAMANKRSVAYSCRYFGISRKTYYKWYKRYIESGKDHKSLKDQSRRPDAHPKDTPLQVVKTIMKLRKQTDFGPRRLAFYLKRDYNINISVCGVYKVLKRKNAIKQYARKKKRYASYAIYIKEPGQKVQVDVKHLPRRKGQFDSRDYQYAAKDVFTKLRFVKIYPELSAQNTVDFIKRVVKFFPFKIKTFQTDHGIEFTYDMITNIKKYHPLDLLCKKLGINHVLSPVATPRYNGQIERSLRTDIEEFYRRLNPVKDRSELEQKLLSYLKYYNLNRPHMAIDMLTPIEKLYSLPNFKNIKLNWECYL